MFNIAPKTIEILDIHQCPTLNKLNSFPRKCRLNTPADFTATIASECQLSGDLIRVFAKTNGLKYPRLGLIVSKRIERLSVKRNWIKRILREAFRTNNLFDKPNLVTMDWVIRLRRPVTQEESAQLTTEAKILMMQLQQCHS